MAGVKRAPGEIAREKDKHSKSRGKARRIRFPAIEEIESELERLTQRNKYRRALFSTIGTLAVVAAIAPEKEIAVIRVKTVSAAKNFFKMDRRR